VATKETSVEMFFRYREDQDKYSYFLLAAAGSALAFAVQKTSGLTLRWNMIALGAAALAWILSFYFGCRRLLTSQEALRANYHYFQMGEETDSRYKTLPEYGEVRDEILDKVQGLNNKAGRYLSRQFQWLIVGAVLFIVWHVWDMFAHTFGASGWAN
jgi:hypothetical protein